MVDRVRVEVKGLRELGLAFKELNDDLQKKVSRSMTNAGAQVIKKRAVQKAPEDTGNLKKNIIVKRIRPSETRLTSEHITTVRRGKLTDKQTKAGLHPAFYAHFVEYGTVNMPAQQFLRPAFDEGKEAAVAAMKDRLKKRIDKANRTK